MSRTDAVYVVLKVAEVCNLRCDYCYFFEAGDNSYLRDPAYISPVIVEQVARFLADGAEDLGMPAVEISLHGGEPLMLGKRRFEEVCRLLNRSISPRAHLRLVIQTNATLLDDEWIDLLSAYEVGIGVSLDGPRHINDRHRFKNRGVGSYDDVIRGIEVLRKAQSRGLIPGFSVGCVLSPESNAEELYSHFAHSLGLENIAYRPPIMDWTNFDPVAAQRVADCYKALFETWLHDNNPKIRVEFLSFVLGAMLTDRGALAAAVALNNMIRAITIRSNGDLCPDDSLTPKDVTFRNTGFNVTNVTMRAFLNAEFWKQIDVPATGIDKECRDCKWLGICRGGPAEERYIGNRHFSSRTVYCDMRRQVFASAYAVVGASVGFETLDRRLLRARELAH